MRISEKSLCFWEGFHKRDELRSLIFSHEFSFPRITRMGDVRALAKAPLVRSLMYSRSPRTEGTGVSRTDLNGTRSSADEIYPLLRRAAVNAAVQRPPATCAIKRSLMLKARHCLNLYHKIYPASPPAQLQGCVCFGVWG